MTTIRRIRPDEGAPLREVRLRALRTDPDAFAASHDQASARDDHIWEQIATTAADGHEEIIFVIEGEDRFAGMVGAFARADEPATRNLYGMWVAPEARGAGLGVGLVDAVVDWSREVGAEEVKLWVVETNVPAVRLYRRAGFVPTGETQPLPSNPELIDTRMRLALT
jgi:GNAT superfamily N-acetyltransferase